MAICVEKNYSSNGFFSYQFQCKINNNKSLHTLTLPDASNLFSFNSTILENEDNLWLEMHKEAMSDALQEPVLSNHYHSLILSHASLEMALANYLALKLGNSTLGTDTLSDIFYNTINGDCVIKLAIREDLRAVKERDPACISYVHCFLNFKGFLACQAHRISHRLYSLGRKNLAYLIQNRISETFAVDIHPGAKIGHGILLDHATGIVIGETAVIGNNVTILHSVTLGGTGNATGLDRHPKICDGVLLGAGAKVLGNIRIGQGAKIGAGSIVLKDVPPHSTAVGNPARLVSSLIKSRSKLNE